MNQVRGFTCYNPSQTCVAVLTSTMVPTVTCESGTSADFSYMTIPYAVMLTDTASIISTFRVYAPLLQLNYQSSDLPASATGPSSTDSTDVVLTGRPSSTTIASATPQPTSQSQGLAVGARAGIGVGVAGGVILLALIAFLVIRRRRRRAAPLSNHQPVQKAKLPVELWGAGHTTAFEMSAEYPADTGVWPGAYQPVILGSTR